MASDVSMAILTKYQILYAIAHLSMARSDFHELILFLLKLNFNLCFFYLVNILININLNQLITSLLSLNCVYRIKFISK